MKKIPGNRDEKQYALRLHEGEIVEVRSLNEIMSTVNNNCELDGLPFMPEMTKYCGKRSKVLRRVSRIIVEGVGVRFIKNVVILQDATCSGEAHDGCKRTCFVLWREDWLSRPQKIRSSNSSSSQESTLQLLTSSKSVNCQSVSLLGASSDLRVWDFRRFLPAVQKREFRVLLISLKLEILLALTGRSRLSMRTSSHRTPSTTLGLEVGEIVEVKSKDEILATLDHKSQNRGLEFTKEMEKYYGKRMRVLRRIDRMIIEKTGKMRQIANTVLLDGANCDGQSHGGCPRNCYCLFRETWLRRIDAKTKEQESRDNLLPRDYY